jgi:hypothetical protein
MPMKLCVLSDSHGRNMRDFLLEWEPEWEIQVFSLGRQLSEIRNLYISKKDQINRFAPDALILHAGHNDLSHHSIFNPVPTQPLHFFAKTLGFLDQLTDDLVDCDVYYSSLFPRSVGPSYNWDRKNQYNECVIGFGRMVAHVCSMEERPYLINESLWLDPESSEENSSYVDDRGLH